MNQEHNKMSKFKISELIHQKYSNRHNFLITVCMMCVCVCGILASKEIYYFSLIVSHWFKV